MLRFLHVSRDVSIIIRTAFSSVQLNLLFVWMLLGGNRLMDLVYFVLIRFSLHPQQSTDELQ